MSIIVQRHVIAWWFDAKTTAEIAEAIQKRGPGAYLRLTPREDQTGEIKLDWSVPVEGVALNGDPGGDDSHMCPPICP